MSAKKIFYVLLFILLGVLVQFFLHGVIEIVYIQLLLSQYEVFGLGLPFNTWFLIHDVFAVVLLVAGVVLGYQQGMYWWKRLYEKGVRGFFSRLLHRS